MEGFHNEIMEKRDFIKLAEVYHHLPSYIWWHSKKYFHVSVIPIGQRCLLKGRKSYFLRAITEQGESYSRDLSPLQDWLQSVFPEIDIFFFYFRDITPTMILKRIQEKRIRDTGKIENLSLERKETELDNLKAHFNEMKGKLQNTESFLSQEGDVFPLTKGYLRNHFKQQKRELEEVGMAGRRLEREVQTTRKLVREYEKKGVSSGYIFSISSNLQLVCGRQDFEDGLASITKEIVDSDTFQVRQKLEGGRLQIYISEVEEPSLAFQLEWGSGILNPRQLDKLGLHELRQKVEEYLMIHPTSDIIIDER